MSKTARRVALLWAVALVWPVLCAAAPGEAAIRGARGEPVARAAVRWSDLARQKVEARARDSREEARDDPMPIPMDLPVPAGALVRRQIRPEAVPRPADLPPSPAPAASFVALPDSGLAMPPDTHGAVGRNHLMVTLNSEIRVQDKNGSALSTMTLLQFWQSASGLVDLSDPRVVYDPYGDRWITTAIASPGSAQSALMVGVSQTGDPIGAWNLYKVDADSTDQVWVDFPSLGFNKNWIVVQGNMFSVSEGSFKGSQIWVFSRANLYAGGSGAYTLLSDDT
ncbi:MAG: hypothetical protein ACRD00_05240, partial [Thermoanaerobaculia bacterium]